MSLLENNYAQSEKSVNFADDLSVETGANGLLLEDDFFSIFSTTPRNSLCE